MLIMFIMIVLLLGGVAIWYIGTSNSFKRTNIKVDEAESSIDVCLTQRYDLLTKLLNATKAYLKHEDELIKKIILLRKLTPSATMSDKCELSNNIVDCGARLGLVFENYPELKANNVILNLQRQTRIVEDELQAARLNYNNNVRYYNKMVITFPSSFVANRKNYKKRTYFEAVAEKSHDIGLDI